jgi:hypothetical protein
MLLFIQNDAAIWMIAVALICVAYAALPDGNRAIF